MSDELVFYPLQISWRAICSRKVCSSKYDILFAFFSQAELFCLELSGLHSSQLTPYFVFPKFPKFELFSVTTLALEKFT